MQYRKRPVVIEAVQWDGKNIDEVMEFMGKDFEFSFYPDGVTVDLTINTLEGDMHASVGDYIIKGVDGEFYPCKPDIFERTYEEVTPWTEVA